MAIKQNLNQSVNLPKQGKRIGQKIRYQQNYWSNTTVTDALNLNPDVTLPQFPSKTLPLVDNFDVPSFEKGFMKGKIRQYTNRTIIFIN